MASPITISVRSNLSDIQRKLTNFQYRQMPFATAQAVTAIAKRVQVAETKALGETFDKPTPFTKRAFGVTAARKDRPIATVFARDIQAKYLAPYEDGGSQVLGNKRAMLSPRGIGLNQYGNIPRNAVRSLKGRRDIFVGKVTTKSGETISGVWQRPSAAPAGKRKGAKRANYSGRLKLLVRFTDPVQVTQRLHYRTRAQAIVTRYFDYEFGQALGRAMATAR